MNAQDFKDKIASALQSMHEKDKLLQEQFHSEIQDILDSNDDSDHKFRLVSRKMRDFSKKGVDSGFYYGPPSKGSSRAVYFPKEEKKINVDGHETTTPYVVKMAYEGELDGHKSDQSAPLFGEMQNELESDPHTIRSHSVLRKDEHGNFHTNPNGVIPPHFGNHEQHHYLMAGRVDPYNDKDFKTATKSHDFPQGITHEDFHRAVNNFWEESHGKDRPMSPRSREQMDKLMGHPLVSNVANLIADTDAHPADMVKQNMGIWTHPVKKTKHAVLLDYGYSNDIMKQYRQAWINKSDKERNEQ